MADEWINQALEAARRYWDASFYLGMCEGSARPELLADGTHSESERADALKDLANARDEMIDAEGGLIRHFSGPTGYPMSADELRQKLANITPAMHRDE